MIEELFKTPVYFKDLSLNNKAIAKYCLSIQSKDKGCVLSNLGGWQSNDLNGEHKILNKLFVSIKKHTDLFAKQLDIKCTKFIGNIWININEYKDSNLIHCHPGAVVSGVYYLQTPKDCGNINFYHPGYDNFQYNWTKDKINNHNTYNSGEWWLPSNAGRLYLFPGWLKHQVQPNLNKKEKRISISFNFQ